MSTVRNTTTALPAYAPNRAGELVVVCVLVASVPLGIFAYGRFKSSDALLVAQVHSMQQEGRTLSMEQCVDRVLRSRAECAAMTTLCDHSVGDTMDACLQAQDRTRECQALGEETRSTRFGFDACRARATDRNGRVTCATAYRAMAEACAPTRSAP